METSLPYGSGAKSLRIPPGIQVDFLTPHATRTIEDISGALLRACGHAVGSPPLSSFVREESRIVILVSDLTRGRSTERVLPLCVEYLRDAGASGRNITVLVARGTHRKMTKAERAMFAAMNLGGVAIQEHDCDDASKLSALLLTTRGTPVRVNIVLKDADLIVLLSPVSFHYFAGFGGGRKLVLPGCADRGSIVANHRLSLVDEQPVTLHPRCRSGCLDRNPVHEDMSETIAALRNVFAINYFCDVSDELVFLNGGDPIKSHREACYAYQNKFLISVDDAYNVMILSAGGVPYDVNLLQGHKALRNASGVLRNDASVLYFAECAEGVGSESLESALKWSRDELLSRAVSEYSLNNQTAVSLRDLTSTLEIGMVSAMNVDVLLGAGIKPCVNVEAFLAEALERHRTNRLAVVTNGASLLLESVERRGA